MNFIFHTHKGNGFPVVLLHGFCETSEIWNDLSVELATASGVRVLTPDLPGFGRSALLPGPFSMDDVAREMLSWLDKGGIEKCVVIGHSLGGYVALAMGSAMPEKFEGIGLFHSTALPDSEEKRENRNRVIAFVLEKGVQPYIDTFVPGLFFQKEAAGVQITHDIASRTNQHTLIGYLKAMRDRPDRSQFIKSFPKPVMILAGEFDSIIPVKSLEEQARGLRKPFFRSLSKSGHMGMFEEAEASATALKSFITFCVPATGKA